MTPGNAETSKRRNAETPRSQDGETFVLALVLEVKASRESRLVEIKLMPWGQVKSSNGDFVVDDDSFRLMEEAFNARGLDVPIDYEHATLGEGPAPAAGWITKLIRKPDDGIYGLVKWNDSARQRILADEYRHISPVLLVRVKDRKAVELLHAGLTNAPAIAEIGRLAAKRNLLTEKNVMANGNGTNRQANQEGTDGEAQTPDQLIGEIATALRNKNVGLEEGAGRDAVLKAVLAFLQGGGQQGEGGEGGESTEVAASVRKELGLKDGASKAEVMLALSQIKNKAAPDGEVATMRVELNELKRREAGRVAGELIANAVKENKLNPNNQAEMDAARELALESSERFEKVIGSRTPYVSPGRTAPPPAAPGSGGQKEDELIANAVKAANGSYANGLVALQKQLLQPHKDQGLTNAAARQRCEKQYPKIFGEAA